MCSVRIIYFNTVLCGICRSRNIPLLSGKKGMIVGQICHTTLLCYWKERIEEHVHQSVAVHMKHEFMTASFDHN
jgi:hypothetical protein